MPAARSQSWNFSAKGRGTQPNKRDFLYPKWNDFCSTLTKANKQNALNIFSYNFLLNSIYTNGLSDNYFSEWMNFATWLEHGKVWGQKSFISFCHDLRRNKKLLRSYEATYMLKMEVYALRSAHLHGWWWRCVGVLGQVRRSLINDQWIYSPVPWLLKFHTMNVKLNSKV